MNCVRSRIHAVSLQVEDVVDGKQRLTTLLSFKRGQFPDGTEFRLQVVGGRVWLRVPVCIAARSRCSIRTPY